LIVDIAARRADLTPERPAVHFRGRWYSYADLDARARRLAARLAMEGVGRGDRVAILAQNHLAHVDLALAAPKLGFIHTPFNTRLAGAEQAALARDLAPRLMLHDARHADPARATGVPKAAMIPYRQVFYNAVNTAFSWGVTGEDCVIQCTPAFHAAFNVFTTPLLHLGGRVVLQEAFEPGEYLALAAQHGCTLLFMVPTMFQMLAEHPDFAQARLPAVRWAISGGAPCPDTVRARYAPRGIRFRQGYGLTEAGVNCFTISTEEADRRPQSVGKPMLHAEAVLRAPDGTPVPRGEVGELTLRGPHLCLGYYGRPKETAELLRDGWLWTGDLARQDADGFFYITGRRKEMYISGGENVYPVEVEAALYQQEEIAEAAVVGVPHARWGEAGLAAVALKPGRRLDAQELRDRLKQALAGYKVPQHFLFLDALPKSAVGKIQKTEIRKLFDEQAR